MEENNTVVSKITQKRFGCLQVFGLLLIVVIITAGATFFVFKTYLFPSQFKPVTLNPSEEEVLTAKLEKFDSLKSEQRNGDVNSSRKSEQLKSNIPLDPEPYSEKDMKREIEFTERELNGLLAKNTDLATKLAIDLSDDLVSAKLLLPVDEDFPVLGGKILRVRSGVTFTYRNGKAVVILRGISIMGVPIPDAWMGGIKNIDLVERYGAEDGFWKSFSDGVEDINVEEGLLKIKLKE